MIVTDVIDQAVQAIRKGKVIIYPTETFYALGGRGTDPEVAAKIRSIKARPYHKPLPLIVASVAQCLDVAHMDHLSLTVAGQFWPGPLSLLVRAREVLPFGVKDEENMVSIRVTSHPEAARLCVMSGTPLIATSANFSKKSPCARFGDIDNELIARVNLVLKADRPLPGDLPSTLVKILGPGKLKIIRPGKVSIEDITSKGWEVESCQPAAVP